MRDADSFCQIGGRNHFFQVIKKNLKKLELLLYIWHFIDYEYISGRGNVMGLLWANNLK